MEEIEIWKPIPGYEKFYEISNQGRVRSLPRHKILSTPFSKDGYRQISLKNLTKKVHRLVLLTFVGPCPQNNIVSHKNDVRSDNRLENLTYMTTLENIQDKVAKGRQARGESSGTSILSTKDISIVLDLYKQGYSTTEIGQQFGVSRSTIYDIVMKRTWKHLNNESFVKPRKQPMHGTRGMYNNHACRCDLCKAVHVEYMKEYNTKRKEKVLERG